MTVTPMAPILLTRPTKAWWKNLKRKIRLKYLLVYLTNYLWEVKLNKKKEKTKQVARQNLGRRTSWTCNNKIKGNEQA